MFGVQERYEMPFSPAVTMRSVSGNRRNIFALSGKQLSSSGSSDTTAMSALLVSVAQKKDKAAFSRLFSHYAPRIKSYLMRQGADAASAEELSQEAMMSVWRKADRFDPKKASAGTWIFTVARNLRIDALRKERRPSFDPEDPALVPEPEIAPDTAVSIGETQVRLRNAVAMLPPDQAEVVKLSFYEDKPHAEIAEDLNLPLGTVKSRLRLAMRRVRIALGDEQ
ncbi:MAG: sigma-70 family RNA polymerase sigma factor [Rhodospirillaceae bacterium]